MSEQQELRNTQDLFWHQSLLWTSTNSAPDEQQRLGDSVTLRCNSGPEGYKESNRRDNVDDVWPLLDTTSLRLVEPGRSEDSASFTNVDEGFLEGNDDDLDELVDSVEKFEELANSIEEFKSYVKKVSAPQPTPIESSFEGLSSKALYLPESAQFNGADFRARPSRHRVHPYQKPLGTPATPNRYS